MGGLCVLLSLSLLFVRACRFSILQIVLLGEAPFSLPFTKKSIIFTSTVQLHRVLRSTPERVYRAFLDANAMAKWLPPNGYTGKVHQMDAKVGGSWRMSFFNFPTGHQMSFGGKYLEPVPNTHRGDSLACIGAGGACAGDWGSFPDMVPARHVSDWSLPTQPTHDPNIDSGEQSLVLVLVI